MDNLAGTEVEAAAFVEEAADFYRRAEDQLNHEQGCGSDGYPVAIGLQYSERFARWTLPRLSAEGQQWIFATSQCLIRAMIPWVSGDVTCSQFAREAYASHATCYVESGFCDLPLGDHVAILRTIDREDRRSLLGSLAIAESSELCLRRESRSLRRFALRTMRRQALRRIARIRSRPFTEQK
jgi:hypothetical protein